MSRKGIVLTLLLVVLAGIYAVYFSDWFREEAIIIMPQVRPGRPGDVKPGPGETAVYPISFGFREKHRFASIKVVPAEEYATNKYVRPLWHLITDTRSRPTKAIIYGQNVDGMKPSVPNARPEPLEPRTKYLLLLETSDGRKGETNFMTRAAMR